MGSKISKWVALTLVVCLQAATVAYAGEGGGGFRFPIGLTYASGIYDLDDTIEEAYTSEGFTYDSFVWPVGLSIQPYYELDFGLGIGASIGPVQGFWIDNTSGEDQSFWIIPVGLDLRYTLLREENVSPYIRGGFRYPFAFGDIVDSGSIGAFGAVGVEFFRKDSAVQFGFEVGYDSSEVDVDFGDFHDTAQPGQLLISIFVIF